MQNVRFKGLLSRSMLIILVACCTIISPQLCQEIEDFEILDETDNLESKIDRTQRIEREVDYPVICSNQFEKPNLTCVDHFCDNVSNYPLEKINNAVKNIPSSAFQGLQGDYIEIANRLSPEDGESLCETTHRTIYPERANNTNNKEVFIVNIQEKKQGIIIRKCREGKHGRCGKATFPEGYIGECTQRYSQVRLLAYNNKAGEDEAVFDTFSIPSCCVCSLKKTSG